MALPGGSTVGEIGGMTGVWKGSTLMIEFQERWSA
jgi:hypothetical protein